ncbi:MAG: SRPBCC family protein [Acidimicrobiia bacterium]|nr:SRPBCC family protein [Acidimicrobiia bacterium]
MATIAESTEIDAPIHEVFAFVADSTNDPSWCANVSECQQVEGDGPGVGARYRAVHKPGPKASELTIEVLEYEPPTRIRWRQTDDVGTFVVSDDLEELPDGRTRITQTDETSFNGIFKLLSPVIHLAMRRTLPKQFAALRAHFAHQSA